jgi:hypothetical protein
MASPPTATTPLVAPAGAVPPSPNLTVLQALGRRVVEHAPNGDRSRTWRAGASPRS